MQSPSVLVVLVLDLLLNLVGKEDGRLDLTFSSAGRTRLLYLHFHCRPHTLTRDLHQSELTERQHVMFGAIAFHELANIVVKLLLMLLRIHINEIDDDDAAYIAQAKLVHSALVESKPSLEPDRKKSHSLSAPPFPVSSWLTATETQRMSKWTILRP